MGEQQPYYPGHGSCCWRTQIQRTGSYLVLFPYNLKYNLSFSMASIHFYQDYLLPSTKYQTAIFERNRQTWSNQRCTDVRVSVSVLPHFFMFIIDPFWCDSGEHLRKILSEPAFKLYSGNGRGRPYNKK